jgi:hypothetical protein
MYASFDTLPVLYHPVLYHPVLSHNEKEEEGYHDG